MKNLHIFFIVILCITSNACRHSSSIPSLQLADSLMINHPDRALKILNQLSIEKIPNDADKAMYALLLTQASDKNSIHHTNDSLISFAVNYYKNDKNDTLKTKAYFYLGRVYQDKEEYVKASEAYLTAL